MPTIKEYYAPPSPLRPSDRGEQEWETYARRAGPLYNAAAQGARERGRLAGDDIESRDWQLNFLNLYHNLAAQRDAEYEKARAAGLPPPVSVRFNGRSSGNPRFGAGYGMAGGQIGTSTYAGIAGANALSELAVQPYTGGQAPHGYKGNSNRIVEPPTFQNDLQREVASEPSSFDDLMKRLTGSPMPDSLQREAEAEQTGGPRKFEDIINDPLGTKPAAQPLDWSSSAWNPANWGWPTFGESGTSPVVTEGREGIQ